jgi:deoxyribose-phosphate aldolase
VLARLIDHTLPAAEGGGADFVKASTGYHKAGGATVEAVAPPPAAAVGGRLPG